MYSTTSLSPVVSQKPQAVHEWAVNLCLAGENGADMAHEPDTKTSFVESETSGCSPDVKFGIWAALGSSPFSLT